MGGEGGEVRGDRVGTEVGRGYAPECAGLDAQASYELRGLANAQPQGPSSA